MTIEAPPKGGIGESLGAIAGAGLGTLAGAQQRIRRFLADSGATELRIPHRANRCVIFNSDLFHQTDEIRFAPGYAERRINITLLYGRRGAA